MESGSKRVRIVSKEEYHVQQDFFLCKNSEISTVTKKPGKKMVKPSRPGLVDGRILGVFSCFFSRRTQRTLAVSRGFFCASRGFQSDLGWLSWGFSACDFCRFSRVFSCFWGFSVRKLFSEFSLRPTRRREGNRRNGVF